MAASQRARYVIERYQGAEVMPQALAILYQSYRALDLEEHAENTMAVLELNFPEAAEDVRAGRPITVDTEAGGLRRWIESVPFFAN